MMIVLRGCRFPTYHPGVDPAHAVAVPVPCCALAWIRVRGQLTCRRYLGSEGHEGSRERQSKWVGSSPGHGGSGRTSQPPSCFRRPLDSDSWWRPPLPASQHVEAAAPSWAQAHWESICTRCSCPRTQAAGFLEAVGTGVGTMRRVLGVASGWRAGSGVGAAVSAGAPLTHHRVSGLWARNTQQTSSTCCALIVGLGTKWCNARQWQLWLVGRLEPGWSGKVPPQRHPRRKSRMIGRSQSWGSQGRIFPVEGRESSEGLRWEGGEGVKKPGEAGSFDSWLMPGRVLSSG